MKMGLDMRVLPAVFQWHMSSQHPTTLVVEPTPVGRAFANPAPPDVEIPELKRLDEMEIITDYVSVENLGKKLFLTISFLSCLYFVYSRWQNKSKPNNSRR